MFPLQKLGNFRADRGGRLKLFGSSIIKANKFDRLIYRLFNKRLITANFFFLRIRLILLCPFHDQLNIVCSSDTSWIPLGQCSVKSRYLLRIKSVCMKRSEDLIVNKVHQKLRSNLCKGGTRRELNSKDENQSLANTRRKVINPVKILKYLIDLTFCCGLHIHSLVHSEDSFSDHNKMIV